VVRILRFAQDDPSIKIKINGNSDGSITINCDNKKLRQQQRRGIPTFANCGRMWATRYR